MTSKLIWDSLPGASVKYKNSLLLLHLPETRTDMRNTSIPIAGGKLKQFIQKRSIDRKTRSRTVKRLFKKLSWKTFILG